MQITNLAKNQVNQKVLQKVARKAIEILGNKDLKELSLVLVGDKKIRELNQKYRRQNRLTDVLSFEELNEIFICLPQAKRQAKALKHSLNTELTRLLVHGIVHLKGYEHERGGKEEERMREIEEKILQSI